MSDIKYEIVKNVGVLSKAGSGREKISFFLRTASQSASGAPEGVLREGIVTSSALRASSPLGEDSSRGVLCAKGLLADIK